MNRRIRQVLGAALAAVPLALFTGNASAILMVTADFNLGTTSESVTLTDDDGDGTIVGTVSGLGSSIFVIANSAAPDSRLVDLQFQSSIGSSVFGTLTVSDDAFVLPAGPRRFTSSTNSALNGGLDIGVQTSVDGTVILDVASLLAGSPHRGSATVNLAGGSFAMQHLTSFSNTTGSARSALVRHRQPSAGTVRSRTPRHRAVGLRRPTFHVGQGLSPSSHVTPGVRCHVGLADVALACILDDERVEYAIGAHGRRGAKPGPTDLKSQAAAE